MARERVNPNIIKKTQDKPKPKGPVQPPPLKVVPKPKGK